MLSSLDKRLRQLYGDAYSCQDDDARSVDVVFIVVCRFLIVRPLFIVFCYFDLSQVSANALLTPPPVEICDRAVKEAVVWLVNKL